MSPHVAMALDPWLILKAQGIAVDPWQRDLLLCADRQLLLNCCRQALLPWPRILYETIAHPERFDHRQLGVKVSNCRTSASLNELPGYVSSSWRFEQTRNFSKPLPVIPVPSRCSFSMPSKCVNLSRKPSVTPFPARLSKVVSTS